MAPNRNQDSSSRTLAKWGMAASMGTLLVTGLMNNPRNPANRSQRKLHLLSGMALVGFSLWHYSLYLPKR